ncbi:MAG TPA: alpha/beta fold hydrolase [Anaerolineae bacterium]|nr:alpha/beta fold hydrolase [Anaerolineae bacterium]
MNLFRRMVRFVLLVSGFVAGLSAVLAAMLARFLLAPPRQKLWSDPGDVGLEFDDVTFPARDGLRLSGWFVPGEGVAEGARPTVVLVHGWTWNRLGDAADTLASHLSNSTSVDLLRLMHALQQSGYNVFMFDMRNHGLSGDAPPVTFGLTEAADLLGALDYVQGRPEAAGQPIGVTAFSMGGNALLYALPQTEAVTAAVAVQPTNMKLFFQRYVHDVMGPLGKVILPVAEQMYLLGGGVPWQDVDPLMASTRAGKTPILYVQGIGDQWGSLDNVARMVASTPKTAPPIYVQTGHRANAYQHLVNNPDILIRYFRQHLG